MRRIRRPRGRAGRTMLLLVAALLLAAAVAGLLAFRSLMTDLAASTARDAVVLSVNAVVKELMADGEYAPELVHLERNAAGGVTAVTTNVAAVNALAAEVLERTVARTAEGALTVRVPVGDLIGGTLFSDRGPAVPVRVKMLSSSSASFRSEMTDAGINQTRHRILLELRVDVSLFMPWSTVGTSVETEILVSDTVVVGEVPEAYMNWQDGRQ